MGIASEAAGESVALKGPCSSPRVPRDVNPSQLALGTPHKIFSGSA